MSGIADMGDGNTVAIGEDGVGVHTYAAAGDYTVTFAPDDGGAAVSTTVTAVDPPPPEPTEQIEWRYDHSTDYAGALLPPDGNPASALALLWGGNSAFAMSPTIYGDPTGQRFTGDDGTLFQIGAYQEKVNIFGNLYEDCYQVGRVYWA